MRRALLLLLLVACGAEPIIPEPDASVADAGLSGPCECGDVVTGYACTCSTPQLNINPATCRALVKACTWHLSETP